LLHSLNWKAFADQTKDAARGKATAKRILAEVYPRWIPINPPFINAATETDQCKLIEGLSGIRSRKLDEAVANVFRSIDVERYKGTDRVYFDYLALACMDRLIGSRMDAELRAYCENASAK